MSVDHHVEVVEFGVASGVAPHLDGRFQGEYEAYGEILKVCGTVPRGRPTNTIYTHTHTLGLSAALHQSPCHPPALPCTVYI